MGKVILHGFGKQVLRHKMQLLSIGNVSWNTGSYGVGVPTNSICYSHLTLIISLILIMLQGRLYYSYLFKEKTLRFRLTIELAEGYVLVRG